jgi:uncharacterized repeat protein (TIGR03803 family)
MQQSNKCFRSAFLLAAVACAATQLLGQSDVAPAAPAFSTLVSFVFANGANPGCRFISDSKGNLYGTTGGGGDFGQGVVFEVEPPTTPGGSWAYHVLYNFTGTTDGGRPGTGLVMHGGHLFGVTAYGGASGAGTIFELTPPSVSGASWSEAVLYSFNGNRDGSTPFAPLVLGNSGVLYGTANGGTSGYGVAFELKPPAPGTTTWRYKVLHNFAANGDGASPAGAMIFGHSGRLYGLTGIGGLWNGGTVYELAPPSAAGGAWTETVLYSFKTTGGDGVLPVGAPVFDAKGALFGTTSAGGASGFGAVFRLAPPPKSGGTWTEKVLYSFSGGNDGANPAGALVFGTNAALYGTTAFGGVNKSGTVFQLSPPTSGGTWTEYVLHNFTGGTDGRRPAAGVVFGMGGALYGTAEYGGTAGFGTVFQLTL